MDYWVDDIGNWHAKECDGTDACESCGGTGWDEDTDDTCGECDGATTVPCEGCYG